MGYSPWRTTPRSIMKSEKYTLTIQETSDGRNTARILATINVIDVNNKPVAVNDAINVNENATVEQSNAASGVLSNDTDDDGDPITIENFRTGPESGSGNYGIINSTRTGAYGSLTLNGDGTYSYVSNQQRLRPLLKESRQLIRTHTWFPMAKVVTLAKLASRLLESMMLHTWWMRSPKRNTQKAKEKP